jgi:hypothetical protein
MIATDELMDSPSRWRQARRPLFRNVHSLRSRYRRLAPALAFITTTSLQKVHHALYSGLGVGMRRRGLGGPPVVRVDSLGVLTKRGPSDTGRSERIDQCDPGPVENRANADPRSTDINGRGDPARKPSQNGTGADVSLSDAVSVMRDEPDQPTPGSADPRSFPIFAHEPRFGGVSVPSRQTWSIPSNTVQTPFDAAQPVHLHAATSDKGSGSDYPV